MKLKDIVFKSKKVNRAFAWAAHIFTASGLIFGFLGLIAILNGEQTLAFLFMGLALVIDSALQLHFASLRDVNEDPEL